MTVFDFRRRKLLNAAPMTLLKQSFLCATFVTAICAGCSTRKAPPAAVPQKAPAAAPAPAPAMKEKPEGALFDGKTLTGWTPTDFAGKGKVSVANGEIQLGNGYMTGITYTGAVPRMNYEISLEA